MLYSISILNDAYRITIDDLNITFFKRKIIDRSKRKTKAELDAMTESQRFYYNYQPIGYYGTSNPDYFTKQMIIYILNNHKDSAGVIKGFDDYVKIIKAATTDVGKQLNIKMLVDNTLHIKELETEVADLRKQLTTKSGSITRLKNQAKVTCQKSSVSI